MKLWQREDTLERDVQQFLSSDDLELDKALLFWDSTASLAHALMLSRCGIIGPQEGEQLKARLRIYAAQAYRCEFSFRPDDEDCHSALERKLTEGLGAVGQKVNTARSRNDQVLSALKLYMKAFLLLGERETLLFSRDLVQFAERNPHPMPGYSHAQKAMPSSVALWAGSYAEALLDDASLLRAAREWIDSSPLGSAAGYGVSLEIDRAYTAELLGFARVQNNVLYVQNCRGKNEAVVLGALNVLMLDLNKLAADLIFFSTPEIGYFVIPEGMCTGSSIMPQKRNPDVLELVRGKSKLVGGFYMQALSLCWDLMSGYNRDFQLTKKPLIEGLHISCGSLRIMRRLLAGIQVKAEKCLDGFAPSIFAADLAYRYVKQGMPFREAYHKIKEDPACSAGFDMETAVFGKKHLGAAGNLGLAALGERITAALGETEECAKRFEDSVAALTGFRPDLEKALQGARCWSECQERMSPG